MVKTADPRAGRRARMGPGAARGWRPTTPATLARHVVPARRPTRASRPIYGYAVASDDDHSYLFGNTFDQNLAREGGYYGGAPRPRRMYAGPRPPRAARRRARIPHRRTVGAPDPATAVPIVRRATTPRTRCSPASSTGSWVAATKVDGYWGDELVIDVADHPWGPWTTVVTAAARAARRRPVDEHVPRPPDAVAARRRARRRACRRTRATCSATRGRNRIATACSSSPRPPRRASRHDDARDDHRDRPTTTTIDDNDHDRHVAADGVEHIDDDHDLDRAFVSRRAR